MKQFVVIAKMTEAAGNDPERSITMQRNRIRTLMEKGFLRSYSLSADVETIFMVFEAESETKVIQLLAGFPLISLLKTEIIPLCFHRSHHGVMMQPSLN